MLRALFLGATAILVGCFQQPLPDLSGLPEQPPEFPMQRYQTLAADGWSVHRVDPQRSRVVIYVHRTGRMQRLGHNHVVSTREIGGLAARRGDRFTADLYLPIAGLVMDDETLRSEAGAEFSSELSAEDKADTRANMLSEKVLDATAHPFLEATLPTTELTPGGDEVEVEVTIQDRSRTVSVPAELDLGNPIMARGSFTMRQSDFDLEPFSIMGGAIGVGDELEVHFELILTLPPPA